MKPFLEALVIIGHNGKRRTLKFDVGVNIITGVGSKGKSSVLHIIDYCLGAAHCRVPVGSTREFAAWYFLTINVDDRRVVIGRRAPSNAEQVSNEAYFNDYSDANITPLVEANYSVRTACSQLAKCLKAPSGSFLFGSDEVVQGNVDVPDLAPLLFQPQNIIATHQLFMPIDGGRDKDRWAQIVKIALKIISPDLIVLRAKRKRLQKDYEAIERQRRDAARDQKATLHRLQHVWQQASLVGVLPDKRIDSVGQARDAIQQMQEATAAEMLPFNSERLADLEKQSQIVRRTIRRLRSELEQIERIRSASSDVTHSLQTQAARIRVVDLLGAPLQETVPCPLCGSTIGDERENALIEMQANLDHELAHVRKIPPELDAAEERLRRELESEERKRREVERELSNLQKQQVAPTLTEERLQRERWVGAMIHEIQFAPATPSVDFEPELRKIQTEIDRVDEEIRSLTIEKNEVEVAQSLSSRLTALAREFKRLELGNRAIAFDSTFSTIQRVDGNDRHTLNVLGGAENFVLYHICALLGLHEQFLGDGSFVPPLLVLDQPSQAFFPSETDPNQTDRKAVHAIYDMLFRVAARQKNRLQIIVLDHADFSIEDERFRNAKKYDWLGVGGLIEDE